MGLLDVLNGMRNGPGGQPGASGSSSSGMSPITMAILALLAYKGIKHLGGSQQQPLPGGNPQRLPGSNPMNTNAQNGGGGLGDILGGLLGGRAAPGAGAPVGGALGGLLSGGLGGLLAGGAAGSILSGGLGGLLNQFQQNGQGDVAKSWVSRGPNQNISESDLAKSIGSEDIEMLSQHTGLSHDELLSGLSRELPGAIDELTPDGRVPTADEASRWV
jgi:uncharacterized protein YidB (DUF937 family)